MNQYRVLVEKKEVDREEIIDFLSKIYGPNYYDAYIVQGVTLDAEPSISPKNFILARSMTGELIGVVRIVERNILLDGAVLGAGCISSVGIKPEWREQGVASNLMRKAIEVVAARGMDISVLYGRRAVDGFYSRFGYYGVGRYVDLKVLSSKPAKVSISLQEGGKADIDICMKLYNETYTALTGSVLRDRPIWEYLFLLLEKVIEKSKLFLCRDGQEIVGYLVTADNKLIEASLQSKYYPVIPELLSSLDIDFISTHPRHPLYIYCRKYMSTILQERFALDGGYMAQILNPQSILEKLGPVLAKRAAMVGKSVEVIRLLNYEIGLENGGISKTAEPNDVEFKKPETAVLFLLGVISPYDVIGVRWTEEKPWIPFLFPQLYYHTSAWDEV